MQPKPKKRLSIRQETIRALTLRPNAIVGGISGLRGCHSIDIRCNNPNTETLCNASDDQQCPSGYLCG